MWKRVSAAICGLLLVAGCTSLSGVKPESVNQSFFLAYALVESAYDTLEISIMGGHVKSQEQARALKGPIDTTKAQLDAAKFLFDQGLAFDVGVFSSTRQTLLLLQKTLVALGAEAQEPDLVPEPIGDPA